MNENNAVNQPPKWLSSLLPVASAILGGGALWFVWVRYNSIVNRPEIHWYDWLQPAGMTLVGILCLLATVLFIAGKRSAWSVFKAGLSSIPLILFINLLILMFRIIQNIFQGNAIAFLSRLYASPLNKVILAVVIIIILLSIVKGMKANTGGTRDSGS